MPSHLFAERSAQPPGPDTVDALISQTRRLRGDVDAVRRDALVDDDDPQGRWQRALCDLAVHHLDDLGTHLGQLKEGLPPFEQVAGAPDEAPRSESGSLLSRVGTAEWNLLTDGVSWSEELHQIFGRPVENGPMSLDELPSMVFAEDQSLLTALVTDCLIDGKPVDGEFRIVRSDGRVRTLHMTGEPVLDADGCTASMWAVLRDVSELRRSQRAVRESRDTLARKHHVDRTERRIAAELQEAVLPSWRGRSGGPVAVDVAGSCLAAEDSALIGANWFDAVQLPDGGVVLSVGDITGNGVTTTSTMAMLLGALRGMAMAGVRPGALLGHLNQLLDSSAQPALGSTLCCHFDPVTMTLRWAQAGNPAPLLFRHGTGRVLTPPAGMLLGASPGTEYEQAEMPLMAGDLLVLHTDGLTRGTDAREGSRVDRFFSLAPRFTVARQAQDCVRSMVEEFGEGGAGEDACVMAARIR
ncbi:SpoIIE family protein phosphatase [Streptomyces sp. SCSIO 30461]|uniref:PP2C family protein-serine/threonine phosphatase n=1 Tax=Streptomyces sp. SCSIO 30461 TaxID=3118085 RepID=UPI0030CED7F3